MNVSSYLEIRLSAALTDAPETAEHGGYQTVKIDGQNVKVGPRFVPIEVSWWAFPDGSQVISGVQLYGARENGRIPNTVYRRGSSSIPTWVPAPPMGWAAFEAMVGGAS